MIKSNDDIDTHSDGSNRRRTNQNTFSWSSTSSTYSTALSTTTHEDLEAEDEEEESNRVLDYLLLQHEDLNEQKLSEILCRAASRGDIRTVRHIMMEERLHPYLNVDASDDDENKTTPLIYASCFGKLEIVKYLLQVGAKVDIQDKIGWTALMWATTNGHSQIVQVLLEYSASSDTRSVSGRTIYELVDIENEKMISILNDSASSVSTLKKRRKSITTSKRRMSRCQLQEFSPISLPLPLLDKSLDEEEEEEEDELEYCEASFRSVHKFVWDQCLPDQMFVFAEEKIDHILDVAISELKLPVKSRSEIYVPANIIFLCSRFAHYFTNRELVHHLLSKAVHRIDQVAKSNTNDIHTLAFWIANLSQLLYYLKKDAGLVVATAEHQLEISELISENYTLLVTDSEKRMDRILEPAMLEFEQLDGLEAVNFADDWHRFFRRGRSSTSSPSSPNRRSFNAQQETLVTPSQQIRTSLTPQSITSLLTSILYVLQSYDVHPVIVIQAMAQLFHFLSCEVFNRILTNKRYLCRSKALQIRMNLTVLEEWVREHHLPSNLSAYFNPVVQLVQLLQCVSQLTDLIDFISTVKSFDLLNPMQVKRLILNYRYEVNEPRLPEEIEKYAMQIAEDTLKSMQSEERATKSSMESFRSNTVQPSSRPNSISSLGSLLYSMSQNKRRNTPTSNRNSQSNRLSIQSQHPLEEDACSIISANEEGKSTAREWLAEKRDSKYMLPFSLPTTTNMVHSGWHHSEPLQAQEESSSATRLSDTIYLELKQKMAAEREKHARESSVIPSIPEEWLGRLDHHQV